MCLQRRAALAFAAREPRLKITDDDFLLIVQDVQLDVLRYHRPGFTPGSSCFTMEEPRLSLDKNRRKSAAKRRAVDKWNDDASDDDDDDDGVDVDSEAEDDAPRTPNREESPPPREVWEASWRARYGRGSTPGDYYKGVMEGKGKPGPKKRRVGDDRVAVTSSFDAERMAQPRLPLPEAWVPIWDEREARIKELEKELKNTKRALERALAIQSPIE